MTRRKTAAERAESARRCEGCQTVFIPRGWKQRFCVECGKQHRKDQRKAREADHLETWREEKIDRALVPRTREYAALEDWILALRDSSGWNLERLATACGLGSRTLRYLVEHPENRLTPASKAKMQDCLGVTEKELERLRPSAESLKEWYRDKGQSLGDFRNEHMSAEEKLAHSKKGGRVTAEKTRGKPLSQSHRQRIREGIIGPSGRGRPKRRAAHQQEMRARKAGESDEARKAQAESITRLRADPEAWAKWCARVTERAQGRRKGLVCYRTRIRELHALGRKPYAIVRTLNDEREEDQPEVRYDTLVRVMSDDMRLIPRPKWAKWASRDEVTAAVKVSRESSIKALVETEVGRQKGRTSQHERAHKDIAAAEQLLREEGRPISQRSLAKAAGVHRATVRGYWKATRE